MMKRISTILLLSVLLMACGSKKKVVDVTSPTTTSVATNQTQTSTPEDPMQTYKALIGNTFGSWRTLQANGNISLGGAKSLSSSMVMKMERNRSIYISVRPLGIMEVAKLVITGDTLIVVDKVHKRYLCENVKLITSGIPANVGTVQDIFLGRAFLLGKGTYNSTLANDFKLEEKGDKLVMQPVNQEKDFDYEFVFDKALKILAATVKPVDGDKNDSYSVTYSNVKKTVAGNVPHELKVSTVMSGSKVKLGLDYKDLKWNESVNIDTSLPKNYERMRASSLLNLLGGD